MERRASVGRSMRPQWEKISDQDSAAIRALIDVHVQATLAHDPDRMLSTCADDIVFMPPGQAEVIGSAACRAYLEAFPTPKSFINKVDEVDGRGDLAFSRGRVTATFEDGTSTTLKGVALHRRQKDGSWKMVLDVWNANEE
jgi:uncharacterized protein (TIGR02246 family)